jgi:putative aldouronate transport system permease protein
MSRKTRKSREDSIFDIIVYFILGIFFVLVAYPLYFIVIASFSDPDAVKRGEVLLWIKDLTLQGYKRILSDSELWLGYLNTVIYAGFGTLLSILCTMGLAYPLSRVQFSGRWPIMVLLLITMYFSGGMIPSYLLIQQLGLRDTRALMIILGMVSVYNVIVAKSFLQANISQELESAAAIDGCGQFRFFWKIVLPLSKSVMAVLVLYYGVAKWNDFMNPLIYIDSTDKYPLALILRDILITASSGLSYEAADPMVLEEKQKIAESIRYGVMIVSSIPVLCLYPFLQKYFVKGVMIGSIKG